MTKKRATKRVSAETRGVVYLQPIMAGGKLGKGKPYAVTTLAVKKKSRKK